MTIKIFALAISLLLLLQPSVLFGKNVGQSDWARVEALSAGTELSVETKNGKRFKGKLSAVTTASLNLINNNAPVALNKDDIRKVYRLSGGSRAKSAIIGGAIGAGLGGGGAGIALAATGGSDDTAGILGSGILIGAAIGTAVGLLAGKSGRRQLVYESK